MADDLPVYQKAAAQEGSWMRDVLRVVSQPNGEFQALATTTPAR